MTFVILLILWCLAIVPVVLVCAAGHLEDVARGFVEDAPRAKRGPDETGSERAAVTTCSRPWQRSTPGPPGGGVEGELRAAARRGEGRTDHRSRPVPTPDPGNYTAERARVIAADLLQSAEGLQEITR